MINLGYTGIFGRSKVRPPLVQGLVTLASDTPVGKTGKALIGEVHFTLLGRDVSSDAEQGGLLYSIWINCYY
jgi:hypothetical protein